jgi:hypothetical protein
LIHRVLVVLTLSEDARNALFPPDFLTGSLRMLGEMAVAVWEVAVYSLFGGFRRSIVAVVDGRD